MNEEKFFKSAMDGTFELSDEIVGAEEIITAGNSFFDRSYFGTRILILAPKPGDEILVAGNSILNFSAAKAEIFLAYSSKKNFYPEIPQMLGVKKDKIIFLDAEKNFRRDMKKLLLDLRANIIFCADFDSQAEFKNLSETFEGVLGEILREEKNYRPEVYKKFACSTALNSPPDFYAPNLFSTRRPKIGVTDGYDFDIIDCANYLWENRVRFLVPELCQKTLLKGNPLSIAISACKNFRSDLNALRILNSDEIFFERRTDNLVYSAKVSEEKICDFKILDAAKVDKVTLDWEEAVQVRRLVIYGNFTDEETAKVEIKLELDNFRPNIDKAGIYLDNVCRVEGELPSRGRPLIIDTEKIFVRRAELKFVGGKNFGVSEVEIFSNVEPLRKVQPFIKLTAGEEFFYTCAVPAEFEKISLGLYRFHVDEPVKIFAETGEENILTEVLDGEDEFILDLGDAEEIVLTAEVVGNPNIYDRAIIRRAGDLAQIQLKVWQWLDKLRFLS